MHQLYTLNLFCSSTSFFGHGDCEGNSSRLSLYASLSATTSIPSFRLEEALSNTIWDPQWKPASRA